jgi:hypothetical protein
MLYGQSPAGTRMNQGIYAANTVTNIVAAQVAAKRKLLTERLRTLPPQEATRARVLDGHPDLGPVLDELIAMKHVRVRANGTLRHDIEGARARSAAQTKVALLVLVSMLAVGAAITLLALVLP